MRSPFFPLFLIAAFVSVAVFGFIAMNLESDGHHGGCIAASAAGSAPCPENAFFSTLFHIKAFKNFSLGVLAESPLSPAFLLLLAFGAYISSLLGVREKQEARLTVRTRELFMREPSPLVRKLSKWLSLREKLDPAAALLG